MTTTTEPYLETFGCALETWDPEWECWDHGRHEGDCDWTFWCSQCRTDDLPCAIHAPTEFPGLQPADCHADKPHVKTWFYASDGYPPPCMYCAYEAERNAHKGCAHSHHRAWRRWKAVHRLTRWGYSMGFLVSGGGTSYGDGCNGCISLVRWGRSSYLLGWDRWRWEALPSCLRRRHWPADSDMCSRASDGRGLNFCVRCSPCPGCEICKAVTSA